MWFKQLKVFEVISSIQLNTDFLEEQLEKKSFTPCGSNTPFIAGWVAPIDEENEILVHEYKNYQMLCLQIEEKILPAYVVRQELIARVKQFEISQQSTMSNKEKFILKGQIYNELLAKAFTRISKIYAYFDNNHKKLILNTINMKTSEIFISVLQKTIEDLELIALSIKNLTSIMTDWLQQEHYPKSLCIEDTCILKNHRKAKSLIRCQGQDLFSKGIRLFLEEGYQVEQIVVTWQDQLTFVLKDNFNLGSVQYGDQITTETKNYSSDKVMECFEADFIIMTETLNTLINNLLKIFKEGIE